MFDTYSNTVKTACRRMMLWTMIVSAVGVTLYSVVLAPLYTSIANDYMYASTVWPTVLYVLLQSVEPVVFLFVYPAVIYALWRGGLKGARGTLIVFGSCTLVKYVINFLVTSISEGGLPSASAFWSNDVPLIGGMIFLELLQHGLVTLVVWLWIRSYRRVFPWPAHDVPSAKGFMEARGDVLPFGRLPALRNPLMLASLSAMIIMMLGRLCNHLIYPLTLIVYNGWSYSWTVILTDVIIDLAVCALGYLFSLWLLTSFDRRELQRLAAKEQH